MQLGTPVLLFFEMHFDKLTEPFASIVTEGEAKMNNEQETPLICWLMQNNVRFCHTN